MKRLAALAFAAGFVLATQGSEAGIPGSGRIAFSFGRSDVSAIYTVRPGGSDLRQLTRPTVHQGFGGDSGPVWSADGRRIAFARDLPYWGSDRFRVHVIGAGGRGERAVTSGPFDVMPTWSPRRTRLAFVRLVVGDVLTYSTIYGLSLGARPAELIAGRTDITPAWSPDGKTIAFARLSGGRAELFLAAADGTDVRTLGVEGVQPAWSPDGSRLAVVSYADRNGQTCGGDDCSPNGEVYVVGADGTGLRRLTWNKADDAHPTWSPDGRRIAFSSGYELASNGHLPWLMVVSAEGGRAKRITGLTGIRDPAWSPANVR
jgi:Tol biopolymer transport system component